MAEHPTLSRRTVVSIIVYSDYLCPWCWPAAVRLQQLEQDFPDHLHVSHRAFPLIPKDRAQQFTEYHVQHRRAARRMTGLPFQIPEVGAPYPRSSLPALEAAQWVENQHPRHFAAFNLALFEAFFRETKDISNPNVLVEIAADLGLPGEELRAELAAQTYRDAVWTDYQAALTQGVHAIPTVVIGEHIVSGVVPYEEYARAVRDVLAQQEAAATP